MHSRVQCTKSNENIGENEFVTHRTLPYTSINIDILQTFRFEQTEVPVRRPGYCCCPVSYRNIQSGPKVTYGRCFRM